ncbi:MAG: FliM/FliN family flagellar motor C-terminal domain-containing protein [Sedimentitalea sp.]
MAERDSASTIQRKMDASNSSVATSERSALRAFRLSLARAADHVFDLPLFVIGATQARCSLDSLGRRLSADSLLILLDGPGGLVGALSADRACVAALTQHQTLGKVLETPPIERPFTTTDAALMGPLIDALMVRAKDLTDVPHDRKCLAGFRFGARSEDLRSLMLTLEAERFRLFELVVDFAGGRAQGRMSLALPEPPEMEDDASGEENVVKPPSQKMAKAVGSVHAEMTAVVGRMRVTLAELSALKPGDTLPLMQRRLDETDLMTITGRKVSTGRLGQIDGLRALRLNEIGHEATADSSKPKGEFSPQITPLAAPEDAEMDMSFDPDAGAFAQSDADMQTSDMSLAAADENFAAMSAEDAAMEISQLAGLSMDET